MAATGTDTSATSTPTVGVTVNLVTGRASAATAEGDTPHQHRESHRLVVRRLLIGNDGDNVLIGLGGDDILKGGGGADTLYGDSGNDTLKGGGGADTLNGGSGIDTASYTESGAGVFVSLYHTMSPPMATPKATTSTASRTSPARRTTTTCGAMTAPTSSRAWTATTR